MSKYPQVLFHNRHPDRIVDFDEYRQSGGYEALEKVIGKRKPKEVTDLISDSQLRGRGGAGFPAGKKWSLVPDDAPFPRYIVVNSDEMEPGTFKDRVLIHANPHTIMEGVIISAYAVGAKKAFMFVRPSYESSAAILEQELRRAVEAGYLGDNILGSDFSFELVVHRSAGRYICGEGTAILNAIMGKRPNPIKPPPYPTVQGLWKLPTVVNNVETLAYVPHIIRNGAQWFKDLAIKGNGTKLYCVSGKVNNPGCFELPKGIRLSEIIEESAGGMKNGAKFKACLPGGASTRFLLKDHYDIQMDFDTLSEVGHRLGTAAIMVFDETTCLVGVTLNLVEFFARESCGWCTPCREGLHYICDLLRRVENGDGKEEFIPMIRTMTKHLWKAYCAFAPGAAGPIESLLTFFENEVREHISQKKCPFK